MNILFITNKLPLPLLYALSYFFITFSDFIATFHLLGDEYQGQVQSQGHTLGHGHTLAHGQGQLHPMAATIVEQDVHRRVAVPTPQFVIEASQAPLRTADNPAALLESCIKTQHSPHRYEQLGYYVLLNPTYLFWL